MAVPIKTQPGEARKIITPAASAAAINLVKRGPADGAVTLPTAMNVPSENMTDYCWMFYGPKKIGKTSIAAKFPGALIIGFEPAARHVQAFQVDCPNWETFLGVITALETTQHEFRSVVIDTGFEAYNRCLEFVARRENIQHPGGQNDYGASWKKVSDEFRRAHIRILAAGLTMIIVAHDKLKECETRAGQKFDMAVPNLSGQADDFYRATVDHLVYFHKMGGQRFLQIRGTDFIMAGCPQDTHFLKAGTREPLWAVPAFDNVEDTWNTLEAAFQNRQEETWQEYRQQFEDEEMERSMRAKLKAAQKKQK